MACSGPGWARWDPNGTKKYTMPTDDLVLDSLTGLLWQREIPAGVYSWKEAKDYCDALELEGYCDWRLPSRIELSSIVDYARALPAIDLTTFPGTPMEYFWSSSIYAGNTASAYSVNFTKGFTDRVAVTTLSHVRCVR
jgi:hypothetical protein